MEQSPPATDPSIPSVPSSSPPPVSTPPHTSYVPKLLVVAVLFLTLGLGAGFILNKYVSAPKPTPAPVVTTSPSPTPDPTANWNIYVDPYRQYSFKYPKTYSLDETARPYLNRNITWSYENISFSDCRGDCPFIKSSEKTSLGGKAATKISGYIGSVGGNIPQSFVAYEIPSGNKYFIFEIEALPFMLTGEEYAKYNQADIQQIKSEDLLVFDQILSTFKFLGQTSDISAWKTYSNTAL
ncbi:MAG: hypothetical protein AAB649_00185 [Patescibacteria group bacterium]